MNKHLSLPDVIDKCHRFRALDKDGLYALAKDLARLTADSFNVDAIKSVILSTTETKKLGTLKSVEKLLAQKTDPQIARTIMGK